MKQKGSFVIEQWLFNTQLIIIIKWKESNTLSITIQFNNQNIVQKDNHLICS